MYCLRCAAEIICSGEQRRRFDITSMRNAARLMRPPDAAPDIERSSSARLIFKTL